MKKIKIAGFESSTAADAAMQANKFIQDGKREVISVTAESSPVVETGTTRNINHTLYVCYEEH